ncbi:FkbM family methyltransferase [Cephaloticoccus capnophilus]|nr:FkbM family methyltransferase [Cephaloticoccus capnophilus]
MAPGRCGLCGMPSGDQLLSVRNWSSWTQFLCATQAGARIEALEPDPVSQSRLRWHRRLNRLSQMHIHPVAASDQNTEARIYQYGRLGSSTSHLPYPDETLDHVPSVPIQTVRLDDWVAAGRVAAPDLIKIDVEGHGFSALCGMRETLAHHLPVIVFAVHDLRERDQGGALLRELGYTLTPASAASAESIADHAFGEYLCLPPGKVPNEKNKS